MFSADRIYSRGPGTPGMRNPTQPCFTLPPLWSAQLFKKRYKILLAFVTRHMEHDQLLPAPQARGLEARIRRFARPRVDVAL